MRSSLLKNCRVRVRVRNYGRNAARNNCMEDDDGIASPSVRRGFLAGQCKGFNPNKSQFELQRTLAIVSAAGLPVNPSGALGCKEAEHPGSTERRATWK
jgi:hypothetical protein